MAAHGEAQYVTFGVGKEVFAAPVAYVREILDYREPFRIPQAPGHLIGLTDVRGRATPTVDLRIRLGLPTAPVTPDTRILVLDVPIDGRTLSVGLVTDRVFEVTSFKGEDLEAAPDVGVPWRSEYIAGVARREGGFVVLIELGKLFTSEDAAAFGAAELAA